ncbi:hypothetical protein BGZ97_013351 [Linnemannia gamsii]|uniref:Uncharacterized protein n=1 Tax=Linnemannia gamsii TaxID=64522 RepID=A0A9P6R1C7_9FUNG|nr:hypothetical protein BGZ97_013351 [Linnemannia gamsii]
MTSASGPSVAASAPLTAAAAATASSSSAVTSNSGSQRNGHMSNGGVAEGVSQDQEDDGFNDDDLLMEMENAINNVGDIQGDDGDDEDDDEDEEMEEVLTPIILPVAMPSAPVVAPSPILYSSTVPGGRGVNSNKQTKKPVVGMPKTPAERAAAIIFWERLGFGIIFIWIWVGIEFRELLGQLEFWIGIGLWVRIGFWVGFGLWSRLA